MSSVNAKQSDQIEVDRLSYPVYFLKSSKLHNPLTNSEEDNFKKAHSGGRDWARIKTVEVT